jgi:AcrR family transcriptional regulator
MASTARAAHSLFRPLPRGPSTLSSGQVARHQRARLYAAMVECVSRRGFQRTTVSELTGLAGVSTRTFYEQFRSKEHCLGATHNAVVAEARAAALACAARSCGWANQLHAATSHIFTQAAREPAKARLVLVDSLEITPEALGRVTASNVAVEGPIAAARGAAGTRGSTLGLAPYAIVGGLRHIAFTRVRAGRTSELGLLAEEAIDWVECYRAPAHELSALRLHRVPEVPQAATPLTEDPRDRCMHALVELTAAGQFRAITDREIAAFARLPTQALHREFPTKLACLEAVLSDFAERARGAVVAAAPHGSCWPAHVHDAIGVYLRHLASHEELTTIAFKHLFQAGAGVASQVDVLPRSLIAHLSQQGPLPAVAPRVAQDALSGAILATIARVVLAGQTRMLPAIADRLSFLVLAPYVGADVALEFISGARPRSADASPPTIGRPWPRAQRRLPGRPPVERKARAAL